jgi:hypothetical protein
MRARLVPVATAWVLLLACPAEAGRRDPKAPSSGGVKVTTSGNQVKYTVRRAGKPGRPGKAKSNQGAVTCKRWSTIETVTVDGVRTIVEHRWGQCFSTVTGRPTPLTLKIESPTLRQL